jgi:hypothetical protein
MTKFSLHPHHIQLSFSENNELIVYSAILMHKIIIPINNLHYFYVFQSNSESVGVDANHFNFSLRFHSEEVNLDKQYDWIELTGFVDDKHIYTIKSNIVFTTNIDNISLNKKQTYQDRQEKTDIYCLMANEHKVFYLNLNWIDRVDTYLKNPIECNITQMRPIYYLRMDNDGQIFSNIKKKPFIMFAKIIMKFGTSFDVDILDVLTFYYQHRSKQIDVLSEQSKNLLFKLIEFLNKVPY